MRRKRWENTHVDGVSVHRFPNDCDLILRLTVVVWNGDSWSHYLWGSSAQARKNDNHIPNQQAQEMTVIRKRTAFIRNAVISTFKREIDALRQCKVNPFFISTSAKCNSQLLYVLLQTVAAFKRRAWTILGPLQSAHRMLQLAQFERYVRMHLFQPRPT